MSESVTAIVGALTKATEGLFYPSESDEPFEVFTWPMVLGETPRKAVERYSAGKTPVIEQSPHEFFGTLADSDDADRFRALRMLVLDRLDAPCVLRVGKVEVGVYLIGYLGNEWVGLRTLSIET